MSSTVSVDGYEVTSSHESAEDMVAALTTPEAESGKPKVLRDAGKAVEEEPEQDPLSKAASELGKAGGKAAAEKRAAEAKEEKPEKEPEPEKSEPPEEEDEDQDKALGKPRSDPSARVAQAIREKKEAEAKAATEKAERERVANEAAHWRAEAERLRQSAPAKETPAQAPATPRGEPQISDYEDFQVFLRDHAKWNRQEWERERDETEHKRAVERGIDMAISQFETRVSKAAEADPTITGKIGPIRGVIEQATFLVPKDQRPGPVNVIADELIRSEAAPDLMLYLSEHPKEFQRIASLQTPQDILRAMAKLEGYLQAGKDAVTAGTSSKSEVSRAPNPVRPVTGAPHTADVAPGDDSSYDDHVRYHNARERRAR